MSGFGRVSSVGRVSRAAVGLLACLGACSKNPGADKPAIRFRADGGVDVTPYRVARDRSPDSVLAVFVNDTNSLPVLGSRVVAGDMIRFTPRFPPTPGTKYVARYRAPDGSTQVAEWTSGTPSGAPTTVVHAIYPSVDTVPMNLLKMYVQFSAPMSTGRVWDFVKLYAEPDSLLSEPFFTGGDAIELWDPDKTRLTILFDPGRIKRDLKPHEERGLPLREGKSYRLVIDSAWPDARGVPLARRHVKRFRVGPQDRTRVAPNEWRVVIPRAATLDSLFVAFPEPLDHALLERLITVRDPAGAAVSGRIVIGSGERRWTFAPRAQWGQTRYRIEIDTELEDLAGNNVRRLFDVAPGDSDPVGATVPKVTLGFLPRER